MAILVTAKKHLTVIGIWPVLKQSFPLGLGKYQSAINFAHIAFVIICLLLYITAVSVFILTEAKTFAQYSEATLFWALISTRVAFYFIIISKKTELSNSVADLEDTIRKSTRK